MAREKFDEIKFRYGTDDRFRFDIVEGKKINLLVPSDYKNIKDSPEIVLSGHIDEGKFKEITKELKETFEKTSTLEKDVPITIKLHSFGGFSHTGRGIHDTIRQFSKKFKRDVHIEAFGPVMSSAALIIQAASLGGRKMSENSWMLIHPTQTTIDKQAANMALYSAGVSEQLMQQYSEIVSKRVKEAGKNLSKSKIYKIMTANNNYGTYIQPKDALSLGLIDEIIKI